jgi:polar amino acid transport system substrate-binding protein
VSGDAAGFSGVNRAPRLDVSSSRPCLTEKEILMKHLRITAVLVLALALFASACSDDSTDTSALGLVNEGTLTVCTDSPYPPMEFEVDGEFTGFDIELMRAIADDLGLETAIVNSGFDPITSGLAMEAGDCDIAAASITITEEREENIDFSEGYFSGDQSLLTASSSGIASLADTAGRNLGVQTGTTGEEYANANASGASIVSFENPGDLILALTAGEVDAVLQDIVTNGDAALNNADFVLAEIYTTDESYGFAVREEGAEDLLAAVNDSLAKVRDAGTYDEIYAEFFPQG